MTIGSLTPSFLDRNMPATPAAGAKKQHEAATQFEALLIGQLLKAAKEASSGDAVFGGDEAGGSLLELANQHLSQTLAAQGGLGLSKMIEKGLQAKAASVNKAATEVR